MTTENGTHSLEPRLKNPAMILPEVMPAIQALVGAVFKGGVPARTLELVHLRTSQINGCSVCIEYGAKHAKKSGETDERLFTLAAWRESRFFNAAERAALGLAEAVTRFSDRPDPVPDDVWAEATRHYDERALSALLLYISMTNLFNRLNVSTRQVEVTWG
jgi:AhpD family alkylhydroperoxidase